MLAGTPGCRPARTWPVVGTGAGALRRQVGDPADQMAAFVVDSTDGLAACVVGDAVDH
jgi:hypothetical protein